MIHRIGFITVNVVVPRLFRAVHDTGLKTRGTNPYLSGSGYKTDSNTSIQGRHTILDYIFFTRPVLFPPVWTIALLGARSVVYDPFPWWRWPVLFIQLACLFGAVYTLNQIFDVESDRINRKLFFLPERMIALPMAWGFTVFLNIAALSLAILLGKLYLALSGVIVILGVLYSAGARPWKNRPAAGFLANIIAHGLIVYSMGVVFAGGNPITNWLRPVAYALAVGGVYLATTVADRAGDQASDKRTLAVVLGPRATMILATSMVLAAAGLAAGEKDWWLTIAAACALPIFGWSAFGNSEIWASRSAKAGVGALTIAAAIAYPLYLLVLAAGFFCTRLFFHWRFGLSYPSFH